MKKNLIAGLALWLGLFSSVQAAPVTVDLKYTGFSIGAQGGSITNDGSSLNDIGAGMFGFEVSNPQGDSPIAWNSTLEAFCVQIDTMLDANQTTYILDGADSYFGDAATVDQIGRLYTGYHDDVTDSLRSAAFQLALWELINEDDNSLLLGSGSFNSTKFGGARGLANTWLAGLENIENAFDLYVLKTDPTDLSQDLLVFSPQPPHKVSEPGTLALLGLAIVAFGLRHKARS
ncbi:PEP-CTERM sorting domain-containing protein [Marinobacteraceae bacterium S3BR75-40.1]